MALLSNGLKDSYKSFVVECDFWDQGLTILIGRWAKVNWIFSKLIEINCYKTTQAALW